MDRFPGPVVFDLDTDDLAALDEEVSDLGVCLDACAVLRALAAFATTSRNGSIAPSGTLIAVSMSLARCGSIARASSPETTSAGMPHSSQPLSFFWEISGFVDLVTPNCLSFSSRSVMTSLSSRILDTLGRTAGPTPRTAPAVEEPVHPPRGPVGQVPLLDEGHVQPAHREVARDARAGRPPANDEDAWRLFICLS